MSGDKYFKVSCIVKGRIVVPRPKQVATKWEIE